MARLMPAAHFFGTVKFLDEMAQTVEAKIGLRVTQSNRTTV